MFKSIEYKLYSYILGLIITVCTTTYLFISERYIYGCFGVFITIVILIQLYQQYNKFNKNILFLLNALDNGDYSFNFSTTQLSKREKELNSMMNRIKEILSKAKREIIENERFLSLIIESVPIGIVILDENNNVKEANQAVTRLLGLPVFTHINQLAVIDKALPQLFANLKVGDENKQIKIITEKEEIQISLKISTITINRKDLRIVTLASIGSELEAKEMESWVRLIRVMTHEIMNSIAPITSLTEMLLFSYKTEEENYQTLKENTIDSLTTINSTAKGLTTFVQSYREFSGVSKPQLSPTALIPFVEAILKLEEAETEENNISIDFNYTNADILANIDQSQINQVIVNIVKNAIEAISNEDLEERKIKIDITQIDEKTQIDIANNGSPIPSDILEHIFIPFFTTKDGGSGIGLSVSRYILRLHGGNLKHNYTNGWTVFSITI